MSTVNFSTIFKDSVEVGELKLKNSYGVWLHDSAIGSALAGLGRGSMKLMVKDDRFKIMNQNNKVIQKVTG